MRTERANDSNIVWFGTRHVKHSVVCALNSRSAENYHSENMHTIVDTMDASGPDQT